MQHSTLLLTIAALSLSVSACGPQDGQGLQNERVHLDRADASFTQAQFEPGASDSPAPVVEPLLSYETVSSIGTISRTTVLSRRDEPTGHSVATLHIQGSGSVTLMDIAFDCPAQTYTYLHIEPGLASVSPEDVARLQDLSSRQLTAFERGEALQRLTFSDLETIAAEDMDNHMRLMTVTCAPQD